MDEHTEDLEDLIHQCLQNIGSHELHNLAQILAFECQIQLERLWKMLESSGEAERIIGYVDSLSSEQKKLLVGRVTLRLLRKITAFMEDMDADGLFNSSSSDWDEEPLCSRPLHSIGNASENMPRSLLMKIYENKETVSELGYGVWGDTDAALMLLILYEVQDQECHEIAKEQGINPLLYKNFVVGKMPTNYFLSPRFRFRPELIREHLCENILKMGFSLPGLMLGANTQVASLSSYFGIIKRYQRLLRVLSNSGNNDNNYLKENPCPPASAASILCLPTVVYGIGSKHKEREIACSVCGDDFEACSVVSYLHCSHVFHWDCIHPWLKARNTCPVCRYEFPTDDVCYEIRRHVRLLMHRTSC